MTEQQWLTSADPAAMWTMVQATATERQCKHFVEACEKQSGVGGTKYVTWKEAAHWFCEVKESFSPLAYRADILREIFGPKPNGMPYRDKDGLWIETSIAGSGCRVLVNFYKWLRWDNGAIPMMAQAIYGVCSCETGYVKCTCGCEFDPAHMPMLADMLEEAGASCTGILEHLRRPGGHVRGCWVIELLLEEVQNGWNKAVNS